VRALASSLGRNQAPVPIAQEDFMYKALFAAVFAAALVVSTQLAIADRHDDGDDDRHGDSERIQVGPRPFYLVDGTDDSALKSKLLSCQDEPVHRTNFSIGHRGAALQFPEHTKESYQAAARMGAGIVECDVPSSSVTVPLALAPCRSAYSGSHRREA
jgi:hypothetical protein